MADYIVHVDASISCPHKGSASVVSSNTRVKVGGNAVATVNDLYTISQCIFTLPTTPPTKHPCVKVQWLVPAVRVRVNDQPVILKSSTGLCLAVDQVPQGPPTVVSTQTRVKGT
jgi:hypothetical protein